MRKTFFAVLVLLFAGTAQALRGTGLFLAHAETRGPQERDALRDAGLRPRCHAAACLQDSEGPYPHDY